MAICVLIADDHGVVRDGLRILLQSQPDILVVGEATNGHEAVSKTKELVPQVVIMDIAMPELNGIDAAAQIKEFCPSVNVLILSMHSSREHIFRAFQAGVRGYVLKDAVGKELIAAVRDVFAGHRYMSQLVADFAMDDYIERCGSKRSPDLIESLSPREREILQLVAEGKTSGKIAEIIFLSPKTVETYRSRIMYKLEIKDIPSLVKFAIKHGLTTVD